MRECKQCGGLKKLTEYNKYYNRPTGRRRVCKSCMSTNNRYKYLNGKEELTKKEQKDYDSIIELYKLYEELGYTVSGNYRNESVEDKLKEARTRIEALKNPMELQEWLDKDLEGYDPGYLVDDVMNDLSVRFRPSELDPVRLVPVYDDTHKEMLDKIRDRFYAYDDEYYAREDS